MTSTRSYKISIIQIRTEEKREEEKMEYCCVKKEIPFIVCIYAMWWFDEMFNNEKCFEDWRVIQRRKSEINEYFKALNRIHYNVGEDWRLTEEEREINNISSELQR